MTGCLTVSSDALRANYARLQRTATGEVAAVVKADGYGLGAEWAAAALVAAGAREFFVATLEEGERLRRTLEEAAIYVLEGALADSRSTASSRTRAPSST